MANKPIIICRVAYEVNGAKRMAYIACTSQEEAIEHVYYRAPGATINEIGKHSDVHEFTRPVIRMLSEQIKATQPVSQPQKPTKVAGRPKVK